MQATTGKQESTAIDYSVLEGLTEDGLAQLLS